MKQHLFVSGPPRSGTTLLRLILSAHPGIHITPETRCIDAMLWRGIPLRGVLTDLQLESALRCIDDDDKLADWPGFSRSRFRESLATKSSTTFASLLNRLFEFRENDAKGDIHDVVGNKKGTYAEGFAPHMKALFREAKFVFIVRDPRDCVRSIMKNLEAGSLWRACAFPARRGYHIARAVTLYPNDVHVLRYEDLLLHPESTATSLCQFLGLSYNAQMLEFYKSNEGGAQLLHQTQGIHGNTQGPLNPALIGQWKDGVLSNAAIRVVETTCSSFMDTYGYQRELQRRHDCPSLNRIKVDLDRRRRQRRQRRLYPGMPT